MYAHPEWVNKLKIILATWWYNHANLEDLLSQFQLQANKLKLNIKSISNFSKMIAGSWFQFTADSSSDGRSNHSSNM